jgi:glycosyltransferase involved in cell wall biosynthesis
MTPTFSVIIPTYNRANLLPETIRSVQNQTFENWECIVVDDGSTDSTKEVVEEIIKTDSRIKYIYQENAERSAARNNGIRNSSGEYICFLDSDDKFFSNHLNILSQFILKKISIKSLIICNAENVSKEDTEITELYIPKTNYIEFLYLNPVSPSRVCIHHEILKEFKFDEDIIIVEDVILWMRIAEKHTIEISNHVGVIYNIHEGNSVNRKGTGAIVKYKGVMLAKDRYPEMFNKISKNKYNDWTSRILTNVAYHFIYNQRRIEGIQWLLKAILMKPIHMHTKMRFHLILMLLFKKKIELE